MVDLKCGVQFLHTVRSFFAIRPLISEMFHAFSKDLLGRTYEYCIARFAAYEGTKGGEFYTPSSIVKTIVEVLKPFGNCRVYDPCCGSGGMFVQSVKFLQAHGGNRNQVSVYGQESNADTWKMAKMNMAIRGIDADFGPYQADTFFNDLHPTLKADFIMANPPFNLSNWGQDKLRGTYVGNMAYLRHVTPTTHGSCI